MALRWGDRVLETSTTTGTGAFTLAAAVTGYQRFSAIPSIATGDTVYYSIFAVDANGNPSGDWETGLGTYSAANTLTRTTVSASTNAGAAVNFAAGTKWVMATPIATWAENAGYIGAPINTQNGTYSLALDDAGKCIYHTSGSAHTWTIPANGSVAFPIGTIIALANENGGGNVTLAITTDTLRWGSLTGSRTIAANGTASLLKVASTTWRLTGDGIT